MGASAGESMSENMGVDTMAMGASRAETADSMPAGPAAGTPFPILSVAISSPTGFEDSTLGTAGLPSETAGPPSSPLLSSRGGEGGSPFPSLSGDMTSFLHPSLRHVGTGQASRASTLSPAAIHEQARRYRLQQMIENPGAPIPSAFEQRRMERAYIAKHSGAHQSTLTPSIVATH